jgi:aromatic-L-amino-acid decarboxylase
VPAPRIYASVEAHSSIDKAAMTLGIGRANVVHVPVDAAFRMRVDALATAIEHDRVAGHRPVAVVATLGTTNCAAVDPVAAIADVAELEGLWLHVDAAYAGSAAIVPELREPFHGWERADSIVVNPHKWLAVPFDASLLLTRRMDALRSAFSLVPEYLRSLDEGATGRNVSEYTQQLGRRFRALKVWLMLRAFGLGGLRRRIAFHVELAARFSRWVEADPAWVMVAPASFSTLCIRWRPAELAEREADPALAALLDRANQEILEAVNRSGEILLSHTRLADRFTIRVALGHIRGTERHAMRAWELLREAGVEQAIELGQGTAIGGKVAP